MVSDRTCIFRMCFPCGETFYGSKIKVICHIQGKIQRSYLKLTFEGKKKWLS